jgi:putative transposase
MRRHSKALRRQSNDNANSPQGAQRSRQRCPVPGRVGARLAQSRAAKQVRLTRRAFASLQSGVLGMVSRREVEALARQCGFYVRKPREIRAFEFCLCCALASAVEAKRGFASVWRLLAAAAGVDVARSAVTQRFGEGSATLMERVFHLARERLPTPEHPEMLGKLKEFDRVLADDGSVLALVPLLKKLFPATRTNSVAAAAKLHATADLVHRRLVAVELTGERHSELKVVRAQPIVANTLYIRDLGYTDYDHYYDICVGKGDVLARLKENANPVVVEAIEGVRAPKQSVGKKLNDVQLVKSSDRFAVLVELRTSRGPLLMYVVGRRHPETGKYHRYLTSLPPDLFSIDELVTLYSLRWVIELLFKLLKSSFHLDHLDTSDPQALRTHIYASLLAAVVFTAVAMTAATAAGIATSAISPLMVGIAAPLLALPLLLLWLTRKLTAEDLAEAILRTIAHGCRDQNPRRTSAKWGRLS